MSKLIIWVFIFMPNLLLGQEIDLICRSHIGSDDDATPSSEVVSRDPGSVFLSGTEFCDLVVTGITSSVNVNNYNFVVTSFPLEATDNNLNTKQNGTVGILTLPSSQEEFASASVNSTLFGCGTNIISLLYSIETTESTSPSITRTHLMLENDCRKNTVPEIKVTLKIKNDFAGPVKFPTVLDGILNLNDIELELKYLVEEDEVTTSAFNLPNIAVYLVRNEWNFQNKDVYFDYEQWKNSSFEDTWVESDIHDTFFMQLKTGGYMFVEKTDDHLPSTATVNIKDGQTRILPKEYEAIENTTIESVDDISFVVITLNPSQDFYTEKYSSTNEYPFVILPVTLERNPFFNYREKTSGYTAFTSQIHPQNGIFYSDRPDCSEGAYLYERESNSYSDLSGEELLKEKMEYMQVLQMAKTGMKAGVCGYSSNTFQEADYNNIFLNINDICQQIINSVNSSDEEVTIKETKIQIISVIKIVARILMEGTQAHRMLFSKFTSALAKSELDFYCFSSTCEYNGNGMASQAFTTLKGAIDYTDILKKDEVDIIHDVFNADPALNEIRSAVIKETFDLLSNITKAFQDNDEDLFVQSFETFVREFSKDPTMILTEENIKWVKEIFNVPTQELVDAMYGIPAKFKQLTPMDECMMYANKIFQSRLDEEEEESIIFSIDDLIDSEKDEIKSYNSFETDKDGVYRSSYNRILRIIVLKKIASCSCVSKMHENYPTPELAEPDYYSDQNFNNRDNEPDDSAQYDSNNEGESFYDSEGILGLRRMSLTKINKEKNDAQTTANEMSKLPGIGNDGPQSKADSTGEKQIHKEKQSNRKELRRNPEKSGNNNQNKSNKKKTISFPDQKKDKSSENEAHSNSKNTHMNENGQEANENTSDAASGGKDAVATFMDAFDNLVNKFKEKNKEKKLVF